MDHNFSETIDEELLTKKKTFFIKLDFIGEEYLMEYKDQSSHQFQRMSTEIKRSITIFCYSFLGNKVIICSFYMNTTAQCKIAQNTPLYMFQNWE